MIALWSRILHAVPNACLMLKCLPLADEQLRQELCAHFTRHGIGSERLRLLPASSEYLDYLTAYHSVDIALDPFPRTGGATTADALWMGVPAITLAGHRFIARQGASMLTAVGLTELIAHSEADYFDKAVALAHDPVRLDRLRSTLRDRMAASPLCDGAGLARALEDAYREMWCKQLEQDK